MMIEFYDQLLIHLAILYSVASIITFLVYGFDKFAAVRRSLRVRESTLLLLGLLGGWPGALVAQHGFRHKTRKIGFRRPFWGTVILNTAALVWLVSPYGVRWLQSVL
ncbi:DUF1294 domain-containing protein [Kordiimonas sp.]|uniref:DUF1294 domain-containing protein n=1 Tax=Kordiimonas sp. TaxID=1970157 RepID=UPI003A8E0B66